MNTHCAQLEHVISLPKYPALLSKSCLSSASSFAAEYLSKQVFEHNGYSQCLTWGALSKTLRTKFAIYICLLLLLTTALPLNAQTVKNKIQALTHELGLKQSAIASRNVPGWKVPTTIVVAASPKRVRWLQQVAPDVTLISATSRVQAMRAVKKAQAIIGYCQQTLLDAAPNLHWIQTFTAGVEHCIKLDALQQRPILLSNAQKLASPEIAEHTIALMMALTRQLDVHINQQRTGQWSPNQQGSYSSLQGRTVLIVGLGGIGHQIAKRCHSLGMNIIATDINTQNTFGYVTYIGKPNELNTLVKKADIIVNAAPLTKATTHLYNRDFFRRTKPSAYFINVARGKSVVTDDLLAALKNGQLQGAGLDVTDPEPLPADHPLRQTPRVIITPHIAGHSSQFTERLWLLVRENLRRYVRGEALLSQVDIKKGY